MVNFEREHCLFPKAEGTSRNLLSTRSTVLLRALKRSPLKPDKLVPSMAIYFICLRLGNHKRFRIQIDFSGLNSVITRFKNNLRIFKSR